MPLSDAELDDAFRAGTARSDTAPALTGHSLSAPRIDKIRMSGRKKQKIWYARWMSELRHPSTIGLQLIDMPWDDLLQRAWSKGMQRHEIDAYRARGPSARRDLIHAWCELSVSTPAPRMQCSTKRRETPRVDAGAAVPEAVNHSATAAAPAVVKSEATADSDNTVSPQSHAHAASLQPDAIIAAELLALDNASGTLGGRQPIAVGLATLAVAPTLTFLSQPEIARRGALETRLNCQLWEAMAAQRLVLPPRWCAAIHPDWSHTVHIQKCGPSDADCLTHFRLRRWIGAAARRRNVLQHALVVHARFIILATRAIMKQHLGSAFHEEYWHVALQDPWEGRMAQAIQHGWFRRDNPQCEESDWALWKRVEEWTVLPLSEAQLQCITDDMRQDTRAWDENCPVATQPGSTIVS
eukprot:COSAG01_NODE_14474_length_1449_cov_1.988148_1_plen_410_part_10